MDVVETCRAALATIDQDATQSVELTVAFSGGLDSTVLLHVMANLVSLEGPGTVGSSTVGSHRVTRRLTALHINHKLLPESDAWQSHCEQIASSLGIECSSRVLAVDRGPNLEARARAGRYREFEARLAGGGCLLLAHHQQDRTETAFLHLLQGRGLFSLPGRRPLGNGMLLRPLLDCSQAALIAYAGAHGLRWITDPSNTDRSFDRNFLRHEILPGLRARFENLDARLTRLLAGAHTRDVLIERLLELDRDVLGLERLAAFPLNQQAVILRQWLLAHRLGGAFSEAALVEFCAPRAY